MNIERYIQLVEQLITSKKITPDEKKRYLKLLDKLQMMKKVSPEEYENKSYIYRGKILSDIDRIIYELNRLSKQKDLKVTEPTLKKMAYQLNKDKSKRSCADLKKQITKLQLNNNITPSFYSIFESLVDEETKPSLDETIFEDNDESKVFKKSR